MHEGRPSTTAMLVAAFRALAPGAGAEPLDPWAERLLPEALSRAVRVARPMLRVPGARTLYHLAGAGLPEHIELRTHAIDAAVRRAVNDGARGLVLLGAGLDARAHRLPELAGMPVWEVDHPATQALKRRRVGASAVAWVEVDFTRDDLEARLREAGVAEAGPLVWVWEGVTPYLPPEAIAASLQVVGRVAAPGSTLLVSWVLPSLISLPRWMHGHGRWAFRRIGEPLLGMMEAETLQRLVRAAGMVPGEHTGMPEWCRALGRRLPILVVQERVLSCTVPASAEATATGRGL